MYDSQPLSGHLPGVCVCISLCQMKGKPLLGHDKACSMENIVPQAQREGLTVVAYFITEPGNSEEHACALCSTNPNS